MKIKQRKRTTVIKNLHIAYISDQQGCGVGSPVIRLRTDSDLQLY